MSGGLFIISAPSGTGKSTIIRALRQGTQGLGYSVSHTTRPPRGSEQDGIDYHFVDKQTFNRMIQSGEFVEWARVYDQFYGTSFANLESQTEQGLDVVLDLDSRGARNTRQHFEDCVLIYLLPPSLAELEQRIRGRGTDDEEIIRVRIQRSAEEIKKCVRYDYIIINAQLEKAVDEVRAIIISERCRTRRRLAAVESSFNIGARPTRHYGSRTES